MSGFARIAVTCIAMAAVAGGYAWWSSPERQIRRVLSGVAEGMSHDAPLQGLAAASTAAGLQSAFSPDVVVDPGRPFGRLEGRDAIVSAAARVLMLTPSMRLEFVDTSIAIAADGQSATIDSSALATFRDRAGQESRDARELVMTMIQVNDTWVIATVKAVEILEPVS